MNADASGRLPFNLNGENVGRGVAGGEFDEGHGFFQGIGIGELVRHIGGNFGVVAEADEAVGVSNFPGAESEIHGVGVKRTVFVFDQGRTCRKSRACRDCRPLYAFILSNILRRLSAGSGEFIFSGLFA